MVAWLLCAAALIACVVLRLYSLLPKGKIYKARVRPGTQSCSLAVFLGSGGHTSEALTLVSSLDFTRYFPRTYIVSEGDILSARKAAALERVKAAVSPPYSRVSDAPYRILTIPRARRVHQTLLTTPLTAACSLLACLYHVTLCPIWTRAPLAEVLLLNGPGTCFVLCVATYFNRLLGLPSPRLIYIESFARVRSLSLSGKLLRPFVDRFVVQWETLLQNGKRGNYRGWLV